MVRRNSERKGAIVPLAAVMLGDQGADVIHIDPPGGSFWKTEADAFLQRGKRRISLDLKSPHDRATASQLVDSADVVIENFRPGVMDRLGLGAQSATERNPRLIYASITAYGEHGEEASRTGYDATALWARTGLMDLVKPSPDAPPS